MTDEDLLKRTLEVLFSTEDNRLEQIFENYQQQERRNAFEQYSKELANANTHEQIREIHNKFASLREELLLERIKQLEEQNKRLKSVNRFWINWYSESMRLFGDKYGRFSDLLKKSMVHLAHQCKLLACESKPLEPKESSFDHKKFKESCDEWRQKEFSKSRNTGLLVLTYLSYTRTQNLSPLEAIGKLTKCSHFPSPEACIKALERTGVKGLPHTWPKP